MTSTASRITRRRLLNVGSLGVAGLTLPKLLWTDAAPRPTRQRAPADACILVFLNGGPSHLDMWDLKPEAPLEIRGAFQPIATSLPGVPFSEHLPRLARHMHRSALVRSVHHLVGFAHGAAVYTALTGHDRGDTTMITPTLPTDYPAVGAMTTYMRPPERMIVPFVSLPYVTTEGVGGPPQAGFFGGLLGKRYDPLCITKDPNAPNFSVPELPLPQGVQPDRLARRRLLQNSIDGRFAESERRSRALAEMGTFSEKAVSLLSSTAAQRAFQLSREPDRVRDAYGRNIYGQSVLLARRLIEAGTRVVSIAWAPDANATWDTHWDIVNRLGRELLPPLDMALASLLDDLVDRGMFERTLVVVMGEFGRAPKITPVNDPSMPITYIPGRGHWPFCYSVFMAGGGLKPGFLYGASDSTGGYPADKPVIPAEIIATIYQSLGIPRTAEFRDPTNRPYMLVPWGEPILEMFT